MSYSSLAPFYDDIIGDRTDEIERIEQIIPSNTQRICEFGCGTGALLKPFQADYEIYGVDTSEEMLKQARDKVPGGTFIQDDIRSVILSHQIDLIFSMYDTINHIANIDGWREVFQNAARHLTSDGPPARHHERARIGVFFFDMNTKYRLETLVSQSPFFHETTWGSWSFSVIHIGDRLFQLDVTSEYEDGPSGSESIIEYTPDYETVRSLLTQYFKQVEITDSFGAQDNLESAPRLFFTVRIPQIDT